MPVAPAHILIVDDDELIRETLTLALRLEGYATQSAANGGAALTQLATQRFDLIVLDVVMPEMTGLQFLDAYRDLPGPHAPVIVCAATTAFREPALARGAAAYLDKLFDLDEFYDVI